MSKKSKKGNDIKEYVVMGLLLVLLVFGFYQTAQINEMKTQVKTGEITQSVASSGGGTPTAQSPAPQPTMVGGC